MSFIRLSRTKLNRFREFSGHEEVRYIFDKKTGLRGFISIHNTNLGPAVGGTRMYPYKNESDALADVLRLSRAMTYKCSIARLPFGGGKAVIIGNPITDNTDRVLVSYAKEIYKLNGRFYTGEDVGITENNVQKMLTISPYFIGRVGLAGDPSPYAAKSTFLCMKLMVKKYLGKSQDYKGLKIAIKGVGKVGGELARMLINNNATLYLADIDRTKLVHFRSNFNNIKIVDPEKIHGLHVDVYSPCAMGNEFDEHIVREIGAKIICGSANNQLKDSKTGDLLFSRGIKYGPDYLVNSGGLINVVDELNKDGYKKDRVLENIQKIGITHDSLMDFSDAQKISPNRIADFISESVFMKS